MAAAATASRSALTITNVGGSLGLTPKRRLFIAAVSHPCEESDTDPQHGQPQALAQNQREDVARARSQCVAHDLNRGF